jgi:dihydrofolate synthase/folylpolyglutamate synthase
VSRFREAVDFIERGLNYEKTQRWQYDRTWLDLRRVRRLLAELGEPQGRYNVVHVAGTKGKGTTSGAIAHCLERCGHRTGLLTSPHLVTHRERVRVDGEMIGEEDFAAGVRRMQSHVEELRRHETPLDHRAPTYFEMLTALAFDHFARSGVEWAVVEVGLGGRLDSTNVVAPRCCVITAIGFDHMDKLGDTPEAIAAEKGGILKPGVPVVIGRQPHAAALDTLRRMADERDCPRWEVGREVTVLDAEPLVAPPGDDEAPVGWRFSVETPAQRYEGLSTPLLGAHQLDNLAAAIGAVETVADRDGVRLSPEAVRDALAEFRVPARIEVAQRRPVLVLDVAHTAESVAALLAALERHFPGRKLHAVFGCSADKDAAGMLKLLAEGSASLTLTQARLPRAMSAEALAELAHPARPDVRVEPDSRRAAEQALRQAAPDDVVCVTGSFYVVGEVRAERAETA